MARSSQFEPKRRSSSYASHGRMRILAAIHPRRHAQWHHQLVDLACFLGIGGIFFAALVWRLTKHDLIPVRDPRLQEAVVFENA